MIFFARCLLPASIYQCGSCLHWGSDMSPSLHWIHWHKVKSFSKSFSQEENKQPSLQDIIELFLCSLLVLNHIRDQKLDAMTRHVWIFLKLSLLVYPFLNNNIVIIPKPVIQLETSTSCSESLDTNTYSYLTVSSRWSKFSSNQYEFLHSFLRQQFAGKPVACPVHKYNM